MEFANLTYEPTAKEPQSESYVNHSAVLNEGQHNQLRPVSYINPANLRDRAANRLSRPEFQDGCDENYETLTDIQTKFNNIYEAPPVIHISPEQQPKPEVNELKDSTACPHDHTEITKIKHDLRKNKILLMIYGLLLVIFLLIAITAVALTVVLSPQSAVPQKDMNTAVGPEAQLGEVTAMNNNEKINILSLEIEKINQTLNDFIQEYSRNLNEKSAEILQTLSSVVADLEAVNSTLIFNINQFQNEFGATRATITSLNNQQSALQTQLQAAQSRVDTLQADIMNINALQRNFQTLLNITQRNLTQIGRNLSSLQDRVDTTQDEMRSLRSSVVQIQSNQGITESTINAVNLHIHQVQNQLNTTQTSVGLVSSQITSFQTLVNNRLSAPVRIYQNCRQDTTTCTISTLINDDRRMLCTTASQRTNITVGKIEYIPINEKTVHNLYTVT